ncbi:tetratricopeptide repeat protein [Pelovirga terrestris]|uniref:Tetratricopeptide repeat protein n=1 Tax=Pelovirga terrestris TaxID=2771352 RepID=A0A8J6URI4_9BACT|nr:tetratricopeptide repeat protein [Pelovirga terrestris]MBD1401416.1 tetratricopeptide repeat protein [Pelovirga terrestris]
MSLINDMLRDLEQRRKQEPQQGAAAAPTPVHSRPGKHRLMPVLGALGLLLMLLLVAGWSYYLPRPVAPDVNLAAAGLQEELNPSPLEPAALETSILKSDPAPLIHPLLTSVNLVQEDQRLQLELTFNPLPAHAEIRALPQQGQVLIRLPETQLQSGLVVPQPQHDLIRHISLMPTAAGLDVIVAVAAEQPIATSQRLDPLASMLFIGLELPGTTPAAVEAGAEVIIRTPVTVSALPVASVATPNSTPAVSPLVSPAPIRTQPLAETDQQLYQRGLQQVREGNLGAARDNLTTALHLNPELLVARLELIGVLQRLADEQQALRVIEEGLTFHPAQSELRKLIAHYLLSLQQYQPALTRLEADPLPALAADPDYHALRAVIYQELGEYSRSAQLYARLLEQRPRESLWWLGLAIALEQQGLATGARDAYRTALDVSGLRPDLEKFVRERLQYL